MLLQLMVYAKIIYLLMVVISGALCTVEDYVIMSQCAHNKAIYLAAEGTVSVTDISQIQNITIVGRPDFVNNNFKIALYAKETQRYLCFNDHWKLVGMKELQDTCYFNEAIVHGYFVFRSVVDLQRRIGFTQRGRAVGPKKTVNDACYMFTKIPTDQFFHQHTHFSTPKVRITTTKKPKTEYTSTAYSTKPGRGSGTGIGSVRTKPNNRFKSQHSQDDTVALNHSGSGSGSGSGGGNKKLKKQRNGNKQRQQKQEMQQQLRGHNYNLSNPKNSTYLNSSRQNLVLSQNSLNNYSNTNRKQSNNSNINNNNKHPPHNHQVRHHHNDPNKVARRQHHDQKQKIKQRQRQRPTTSTSILTLPATSATTDVTSVINSTKPHYTLSTSQTEINPTSVSAKFSTVSSDNDNTLSSTVVVTKRKGRRRKTEKLHKNNGMQKKHLHEVSGGNSKELLYKIHTYTSSVGPTYEEEDDNFSSSTDYAWMTNDIMLSSAKPTSASLPSWETWYPSSTTILNDESSDYSVNDSTVVSSPTEIYGNKRFTTISETSLSTDVENNTLTLQTSVPLPTTVFTTTLMDNSFDETILPSSVTTDLGIATTTTNTSTYTQTDFWSTSLNGNFGVDTNMMDMQSTKQLNSNYVTPKLENVHTYGLSTESYLEDTNANSSNNSIVDMEQTTDAITVTLTSRNDKDDTSEGTTLNDDEKTTRNSKANEAKTTTSSTTIDSNNCAYRTAATHNGSVTNKTTTDCTYSTKTTEPNANYHSSRQQKQYESSPSTVDLITTAKQTTNWPDITPSQSLLPTSQTQVESKLERKTATNVATTATTLSSSKFTVLAPMTTTRRTLRKSTQRLLATPFHQLTYVRNEAGDIDIDSIDNISIYPEIFDNDNIDEPLVKSSTSRLTMISGYLPTSATATLPESIRIAKIKINRERKRIMRLRNVGNYA